MLISSMIRFCSVITSEFMLDVIEALDFYMTVGENSLSGCLISEAANKVFFFLSKWFGLEVILMAVNPEYISFYGASVLTFMLVTRRGVLAFGLINDI